MAVTSLAPALMLSVVIMNVWTDALCTPISPTTAAWSMTLPTPVVRNQTVASLVTLVEFRELEQLPLTQLYLRPCHQNNSTVFTKTLSTSRDKHGKMAATTNVVVMTQAVESTPVTRGVPQSLV